MKKSPKQGIRTFFANRFNRVVFAVFAAVLVLNILAVNTSDDLGYQISNGIIDIFRREYIQYMTWTGRSVAHILARSFLAMPKGIFDVFNSLCFVYLNWMIYCHATGSRKKDQPLLYLLISLMVFLFAPLFGQTCLWETGSCNYLWTTSIVLTFLLPYRLTLETSSAHGRWFPFGFFLLGIIAGWTNENTGGAMILLVLLLLVLLKQAKKKLQPWMLSGLLGAVIGFAVMILAPGNKVRAAEFVSTNGKVYDLVHDLTNALDVLDASYGMRTIFVIWAAVMVLFWCLRRDKMRTWLSAIYVFCGIAAVFAIILTPVQVLFDRSMFGATVFILIGIGLCLNGLRLPAEVWLQRGMKVSLAVMLLFSVWNYSHALVDLGYTRYQNNSREAYVAQQKAAGNLNPVVPLIYREFETSYNPLHGLNDITPYPKYWVNQYYEQVHGISTVQSTPLKQWNLIYKNGDPTLMNIQDINAYIAAVKANSNDVLLINCSTLNRQKYAAEITALKALGIELAEDDVNFVAVYQNGSLTQMQSGTEGLETYGKLGTHQYYLASYADGAHCDILLDGTEYTNDHSGISFVVFDTSKDRVVDSVSFDESNEMVCVRYKTEE